MPENWMAVREHTTRYLQDLVRIDTTNPPGNEVRAAEFLASILRNDGFEPQVLESAPGRGNLVARLPGDGRAAPLMLMAHLDVVPAEADQWSHAPFSGEHAGGFIWGRGTLDTKDLVAMELMVMLMLKRERRQLSRDVIFMANADEEAGGNLGAGWMVREHPDLIRSEYAINEGGGFALEVLGHRFFTCQTGEKGTARFAMRTHGRPGHASQPHSDNCVLKLAEAVQRIAKAELPVHPTEIVRTFIEGVAAHSENSYQSDLRALLDPQKHHLAMEHLPLEQGLCSMFHAMLHNTVTPTILRAGSKINVIPSVAEARCDGRVLPGQTAKDLLGEVRRVLGNEIEIEFLDDTPAFETTHKTPLFDAIRRTMQRFDRDVPVLPYLVVGATDARHVRKLGTKVYGFTPMSGSTSELDRVHGHDERISIENLGFGTHVLYDLVTDFCSVA